MSNATDQLELNSDQPAAQKVLEFSFEDGGRLLPPNRS